MNARIWLISDIPGTVEAMAGASSLGYRVLLDLVLDDHLKPTVASCGLEVYHVDGDSAKRIFS
jgi:hypothetical protein